MVSFLDHCCLEVTQHWPMKPMEFVPKVVLWAIKEFISKALLATPLLSRSIGALSHAYRDALWKDLPGIASLNGLPHGLPSPMYAELLAGRTPNLASTEPSQEPKMEVEQVEGLDQMVGPPTKRARTHTHRSAATVHEVNVDEDVSLQTCPCYAPQSSPRTKERKEVFWF